MKKFLITLLLGIIVGAGGYWYYTEGWKKPVTKHVESSVEDGATRAKDAVVNGAGRVKYAIQARLESWNLRSDDIKEEFSRTGTVIRLKARNPHSYVSTSVSIMARKAKGVSSKKCRFQFAQYIRICDSDTEKFPCRFFRGILNPSGDISKES